MTTYERTETVEVGRHGFEPNGLWICWCGGDEADDLHQADPAVWSSQGWRSR